MLKLTVAVLALALAGTAGADSWRKLRVDASSEAAFSQSLDLFKEKLTPDRAYAFGEALKDIWIRGATEAQAAQREYTADDYYRQVHGLTYEGVVTFTDPSGVTARTRKHQAFLASRSTAPRGTATTTGRQVSGVRPAGGWGTTPSSVAEQQQACRCFYQNGPQGD
jgi:hypothetical protein